MDRSDGAKAREVDWRGWLALAWAIGTGLLYVLMLVREKVPGLLARFSTGG